MRERTEKIETRDCSRMLKVVTGMGGESKKDEPEIEEEPPTVQSQRPARVRRPPDRYGEWILNSLQQITARKDDGGQAEAGQAADKETETKIAEEG